MRIKGQPFAIEVIGEDDQPVTETKKGHAKMAHGELYKIRIKNETDTRAAIQFSVDGTPFDRKLVIPANSTADLETIPNTGKRLTFFAEGTDEAKQALLGSVSDDNLGVISATFEQERKFEPPPVDLYATRSFGPTTFGGGFRGASRGLGAGGTGLSGYSNQTFGKTYFDTDTSKPPVTINVRLVHDPKRERPLDAHAIPGRVQPVENKVPPPVSGRRAPTEP